MITIVHLFLSITLYEKETMKTGKIFSIYHDSNHKSKNVIYLQDYIRCFQQYI